MIKILEKDLWKPVSDFLEEQGYTVRSEVKDCDVVGVKDEELVIIELKKNLSVALLAQAVKRQKTADLVYIAVPKPKRMTASSKWRDICHLIRRLELGLILVSFKSTKAFIEIPIQPMFFDRDKSMKRNKKAREALVKEVKGRKKDFNVGGSTRQKLVTAYRESSIFIACCLQKFGALSTKQLREIGTDTKKTSSILYQNYYGWFFNVKKGVYDITEEGKKALLEYGELAEYYAQKLLGHDFNT